MKKALSVILCFVMLVSLVPLYAYAEVTETSGSYEDKMTWQYDKDTKTLTVNCDGPLDFPYEDRYVEYFPEFGPMFSCRAYPWNINGILNEAEHLNLNGNITEIGAYTFYCFSKLIELNIPNTVTKIGSGAFSHCSTLTEVEIPSSVKYIGSYAFASCTNLKKAVLNEGLEYLGQDAFSSNQSLETFNMPESITMTGVDFVSVYSNYPIHKYVTHKGNLYYFDNYIISGPKSGSDDEQLDIVVQEGTKFIPERLSFYSIFSGVKSVTLANTVKSIGYQAFQNTKCGNLVIPGSVKTIEDEAFYYAKIDSLKIENGVTEIGEKAFSNAVSGQTLTLPNSVKAVGKEAFKGAKVTSVKLSSSMQRLEDGVFANSGLTSFTVPRNINWISSTAFDSAPIASVSVDKSNPNYTAVNGVLFSKNKASLIYYPRAKTDKNYIVPSGVKYIYSDFTCIKLETVTLPKTLAGMYKYTYKKLYYFGTQDEFEKIPKAKLGKQEMKAKCCKAKLSRIKYNYDGKKHTPKIKVYDPAGNLLKKNTDYTVTLPKGRKKINIYTVKIKLKGRFKGEYKLTYRIAPEGTDFTKVVQGSGKVTMKWKKQTKNTTGYEIQYSKNADFASGSNKIATIKKAKGSMAFSDFSVGTPYYLRIRTYKQVGKKRVYSAWGKTKKVVVKSPF